MKHRLNLLPKEFQDAMASARRVKRWMLFCCLAGVVCLGILYKERQDLLRLEQEQQKNSAEVKSLRLMQKESQAAREKLEKLRTKHTLVSMLESELPVVQILGVFSQSARDPERRIEVAELRADEILRNAQSASSLPKPANARKGPTAVQEKVLAVIVTGVAHDDMIVARFVGKLRDSKMFQSVKLTSTSGDHQQSTHGRHFEVECVY